MIFLKNIRFQLSEINQSMLIWAVGRLADTAMSSFLSFFLVYYYNQVLGLDPLLTTLAIAISMVFDGLSDPIVALHSDYHKRDGRKRTDLMRISIIPTILCFILLFMTNENVSSAALFLQLLALMAMIRLCITLYTIPREAIGVEMFKQYSSRNKLWALNSFFGVLGTSIALGPALLFFIPDWGNKQGYWNAVIWVAVVYFITSYWSTQKLSGTEIFNSSRLNKNYTFHSILCNIFTELISLVRNPSWLALLVGCLLFSIQFGLTSGTSLYFNNYLWGWAPHDLFWVGVFSLPGSILGACCILFARITNKKKIAICLGLLASILSPLLLVSRLIEVYFSIDILPQIGLGAFSDFWWFWVVHQLMENLLWTSFWILIASMFSDTIEDHEVRSGKRREGLVLSANNFINKTISGGGLVFTGFLLTISGFTVEASEHLKELATLKLAIFKIITYYTLSPVALYFISFYKITHTDHRCHLSKLQE